MSAAVIGGEVIVPFRQHVIRENDAIVDIFYSKGGSVFDRNYKVILRGEYESALSQLEKEARAARQRRTEEVALAAIEGGNPGAGNGPEVGDIEAELGTIAAVRLLESRLGGGIGNLTFASDEHNPQSEHITFFTVKKIQLPLKSYLCVIL